ncbi:MAG: molybdate ABC transporter substrate-binding protein [Lautropia sp.]
MSSAIELKILCAGAAQGLVKALQPAFTQASGAGVSGRFGAVGAMKEALLAGEPCDLMIVTDAMIDTLVDSGALDGASRRPLGRVRTGVAVREGEPRPDISNADALRAALLLADGIYFPDPERATAGIHFAGVMKQLGVHDALQARFRTFPNGATAMAELARTDAPRLIGCTQVTEINYTAGVTLVGALPDAFELATVYTAAVSARAAHPALAARFVDLLAGAQHAGLRAAGGFE